MYSQLNEQGQAAIVCSQGVLFRGGVEKQIRKGLIHEDAIEAVIALPEKLFFGTGIPACILILNRNKPKPRKNTTIFIYGARDYRDGKNRNTLRNEDVSKIASTFRKYINIDRYSHVANVDEIEKEEYNLNVPRYVDISEPEEEVDIQVAWDELGTLGKKRHKLESQIKADLKGLGLDV